MKSNNIKNYMFITETSGIDFGVYIVEADNKHEALSLFCKYDGVINYKINAINAVSFDEAMLLANEWLTYSIVSIYELPKREVYSTHQFDVIKSESKVE